MAAAVASVAAAAKQTFRPFLGSISKRVELARKRKLLYIDCHSEAQVFLCKNELIYPEKITGIFSSYAKCQKYLRRKKCPGCHICLTPGIFRRKWNLILTSIFIHKQSVWAKLQEWHLKWKNLYPLNKILQSNLIIFSVEQSMYQFSCQDKIRNNSLNSKSKI